MEESKKIDLSRPGKKLRLFFEALRLVWKSSPLWAALNTVISILRSIMPLAFIWLIRILTDSIASAVSSGMAHDGGKIMILIILAALLYFTDEVLSELGNYARKKQSDDLEQYMYGLLHSKSVRIDLINFEKTGYFDILTRAVREAPWRPNSILNNMVSVIRALLSLVLMAGLILTFRWTIVIIMLAANIPSIWLRLHFSGVLYHFHRDQTAEARKSAYFNWLLTGDRPSREIRLFGLGEYFINLFNRSFSRQKNDEMRIIRKRTYIEMFSALVRAAAFLVVFRIIASATLSGSVTLGQMAMVLIAFRQGMISLKDLFSATAGLYEDSLFIEDAFEFLGLRENIKAEKPVTAPGPLEKNIVLNNLSFSYPGNHEPAIRNVSFEIGKGEIIAIVGPNGAGKSTLARLLCRLYDPDSGSVEYDGLDIRHFDPDLYRKYFSVVFQDFMLYNLTAGENIRMGNTDENDQEAEIRVAATKAGISDLIEGLPSGYNTMIGNLFEDSRELSWGEWQKLAIARSLFRNAPVMILDEPSSALDADSEYEIFSRLRDMVRGRTAILISHRFTNVTLADRIIVLENGSVAESGTHEELIRSGGIYTRMYLKQTNTPGSGRTS